MNGVKKVTAWLLPASVIYGWAVRLRNYLFDQQLLKEHVFPLPIICIGNLSVGGTGKTPHTEYLIRLLKDHYRVAVLSRGYKRKTKGFILADAGSTARQIGDEPMQMHRKFPDIHVAVCAKRTEGIRRLLEMEDSPQVILLDDGYQHRHVKAGLNILLFDCQGLQGEQHLLPAGRLREPFHEKRRADIVIVTKCPEKMAPIDYRIASNHLKLAANQHLFFSTIRYKKLKKVFSDGEMEWETLKNSSILLLTGIANPYPMEKALKQHCQEVHSLAFADHHHFTMQDIAEINHQFAAISQDQETFVVTTEKDAARLLNAQGLDEALKAQLYALPIDIHILKGSAQQFNNTILNYVRRNQGNN